MSEVHTDDLAVDRFAQAMKAKLAEKRAEGRGGWENCSAEYLSKLLIDHVYKGDPLDVANLAMMLHQNGQRIVFSGWARPSSRDLMLQFFEYEHLPPHLQEVSKPFGDLARQIVATLPRNPERAIALRKLLEAKDCAVRAKLYKD